MTIKYSFLPVDQLVAADFFKEYEKGVEKLIELFNVKIYRKLTSAEKLRLKRVEWCLSILKGLKERLQLGEENKLEYAIDIIVGEIVPTTRHPTL